MDPTYTGPVSTGAIDTHREVLTESESSEPHSFDTTSLSSSTMDYQYENGRRYHSYGDADYFLPNDQDEQDRLDLNHHCYTLILGGELHIVPLGDNPQKILDVGTGTGIWAMDMGDRYPSAEVIGIDISPIQPTWVPPNVRFELEDAEKEWTYPKNYFDLIHSRNLAGGIKDWPSYICQIYDHVKPNGWIQLIEYRMNTFSDDSSVPHPSKAQEYFQLINEAGTRIGVHLNIASNLKSHVHSAGFTDIKEIVLKAPWSPWPKDKHLKEIGKWTLLSTATGAVEAHGLALLTRVLGMSSAEAKEMCLEARCELGDVRHHSYSMHHIIIARKPADDI